MNQVFVSTLMHARWVTHTHVHTQLHAHVHTRQNQFQKPGMHFIDECNIECQPLMDHRNPCTLLKNPKHTVTSLDLGASQNFLNTDILPPISSLQPSFTYCNQTHSNMYKVDYVYFPHYNADQNSRHLPRYYMTLWYHKLPVYATSCIRDD